MVESVTMVSVTETTGMSVAVGARSVVSAGAFVSKVSSCADTATTAIRARTTSFIMVAFIVKGVLMLNASLKDAEEDATSKEEGTREESDGGL